MPIIQIVGKDYYAETLSDEAKNQLSVLQIVRQQDPAPTGSIRNRQHSP